MKEAIALAREILAELRTIAEELRLARIARTAPTVPKDAS